MKRHKGLFERKSSPVISGAAFVRRYCGWLFVTALFMGLSLAAGILGYHCFESLSWLDSLLNAAMILGGMGEIDTLHTVGGKVFASVYALYGGIFMIVCSGLLLAPIFHRILHRFHAEQ